MAGTKMHTLYAQDWSCKDVVTSHDRGATFLDDGGDMPTLRPTSLDGGDEKPTLRATSLDGGVGSEMPTLGYIPRWWRWQ